MGFTSFVIEALLLSVHSAAEVEVACDATATPPTTCASGKCMTAIKCTKEEVISGSCTEEGSYIKYEESDKGYCYTESADTDCDELTKSCGSGDFCKLGMCITPCYEGTTCATCLVHLYCAAGITDQKECTVDPSVNTGKYTQYLAWDEQSDEDKEKFLFGYCATGEVETDKCTSKSTCASNDALTVDRECDQDQQCVMRCADGEPCAPGYVCAEPTYCNKSSDGNCTRYLSELESPDETFLTYTLSDTSRSLCVKGDLVEGDACNRQELACPDNLGCNLTTKRCEKLNKSCDASSNDCPMGRTCRRVAECDAVTYDDCQFISEGAVVSGPLLYVGASGTEEGICMTDHLRSCNSDANSCPGDQFCVDGVCKTVTCNGWTGCSGAYELCMTVQSCTSNKEETCTTQIPADLSNSILMHKKAGFQDQGRCFTTSEYNESCDAKSKACKSGLACVNGECKAYTKTTTTKTE